MQRGDLVTVSLHGDYGKPRPAVIVQSNLLNEYGAQYWIRTSDLRLRRPKTPIFNPFRTNVLQK